MNSIFFKYSLSLNKNYTKMIPVTKGFRFTYIKHQYIRKILITLNVIKIVWRVKYNYKNYIKVD